MAVHDADIAACASEPIHLPGAIQPHGSVLICDEQLRVLQVAENCPAHLDREAADLLDRPIDTTLGAALAARLREVLEESSETLGPRPIFVGRLDLPGGRCADVLMHRHADRVMLEFEPAPTDRPPDFTEMYRIGRGFVAALQRGGSVRRLCELAVREMRRLTGFDRVLAYAFDDEGHGEVLAEDLAGTHVTSYLGQRFPAGDIPPQARELYRLNPIRLIPDAGYTPCPLLPRLDPRTHESTDLSHSGLRSVSPVHLQYMRNMRTEASLSVSILVRGRLWGLISCHHPTPRHVSFERRAVCEHIGQILALQIEATENQTETAHRLHLRQQLVRMLALMADEGRGVVQGLLAHPDLVLGFMQSSGAAIVEDGQCHLIGRTPSERALLRMAQWLGETSRTLFHSAHLLCDYPQAAELGEEFGGALAVAISELHDHWVIWFRPEVTRVVRWAGQPGASEGHLTVTGGHRVPAPRNSFEEWREVQRNRSEPWRASEIDIAGEFRSAILAIVMRRAEETAELADALRRSNHELEAFSYSVSHDLRAPLRHIVGYSDLLRELKAGQLDTDALRYVTHIGDAAVFAGQLVDNLLSFSQMGRAALKPVNMSLQDLMRSVVDEVDAEFHGRDIRWQLDPLPEVRADPAFLRLALRNLVGNAAKYSQKRTPPCIHIRAEETDEEIRVHIRDNGVGFSMKYVDKLFGIFQRLHRIEEFEGTGIGLANVKRIVERHGGRVWAQGEPDAGATFSFALPKPPTASA